MTHKGFVQCHFGKIFILILFCRYSMSFSNSISQVNKSVNNTVNYSNELTNPCHGRKDGFVRDLSSCQRYYHCDNEEPILGTCDDGYVFYAETEQCVDDNNSDEACFRCNVKKQYELVSVPNICQQYIRCMHGAPSLRICPNGLVFDGRAGIHQCNIEPSIGGCYREDRDSIEQHECPPVINEPIHIIDPKNKSVYYVCWGQKEPHRAECSNSLHFNVNDGVCDYPLRQRSAKQ